MAEILGRELAALDEVQRMLAASKSVNEVKDLRDKAEALRKYAKDARLGLELQNRAAEAKLRAERKAGEMLSTMEKARGGRPTNRLQPATGFVAEPSLRELGIEKTQSHRWQRLAAVPDRDFEAYLREAREAGREISASGLLRLNGRRQGGPCERRSRRDSGASVNGREPVSSADLLEESRNHCGQLANLLGPACDEPPATLTKAERRLISRLVRELSVYLHIMHERENRGAVTFDSSNERTDPSVP